MSETKAHRKEDGVQVSMPDQESGSDHKKVHVVLGRYTGPGAGTQVTGPGGFSSTIQRGIADYAVLSDSDADFATAKNGKLTVCYKAGEENYILLGQQDDGSWKELKTQPAQCPFEDAALGFVGARSFRIGKPTKKDPPVAWGS